VVSIFADTSATVKLYLPEPGHEFVRAIEQPLVISWLTLVEVPSALWGKHRGGALSLHATVALNAAFQLDVRGAADREPRFQTVRFDERVLQTAADLVGRTPLRAGDAIQLASAVQARAAAREITHFAAFDGGLRSAAAIEGFALVPRQL